MPESNPRVAFTLASQRRLRPAPAGRIMAHIVVNVECWRYDQPMPRALLSAPQGLATTPDVPNFSWAEYGLRCGMPRLMALLDSHSVPVTCAMNADITTRYPALADAVFNLGWEIMGHGLHQRPVSAEPDETAIIAEALHTLRSRSGQRVTGWLGPGLSESADTPEILQRRGIEYLCDWVLDDLPCWLYTAQGPLIAVPYTLEVNDSVLFAVNAHRADEILQRGLDTLETYARESADQPRVLTVALHPHLIAVPHRMPSLEALLDRLVAHPHVSFCTGRDIADWYACAGAHERRQAEVKHESA